MPFILYIQRNVFGKNDLNELNLEEITMGSRQITCEQEGLHLRDHQQLQTGGRHGCQR
jgi:hypothetical protein